MGPRGGIEPRTRGLKGQSFVVDIESLLLRESPGVAVESSLALATGFSLTEHCQLVSERWALPG